MGQGRHPAAPASADRILRDLRARQVVGYEVVSRTKSLYRITNFGNESETGQSFALKPLHAHNKCLPRCPPRRKRSVLRLVNA